MADTTEVMPAVKVNPWAGMVSSISKSLSTYAIGRKSLDLQKELGKRNLQLQQQFADLEGFLGDLQSAQAARKAAFDRAILKETIKVVSPIAAIVVGSVVIAIVAKRIKK